ncbi:hypothetical protein BHE89_21750 [Shigella sp. FC1967]|nr:hypothetical protein BHE89_21750 [Shigella sp. FC1967]
MVHKVIANNFFVFGPRDPYRPGETLIVNALLRKPALDLSEFDIGGPQGYSKQFFCFRPS